MVNVTMLTQAAPALLTFPPETAFRMLDAHCRDGRTERSRHGRVVNRLNLWCNEHGFETLVDRSLHSLKVLASKGSRRIDIIAIDRRKVAHLIEVTVVQDDKIDARIREKEAKYADLPEALSRSQWAIDRGVYLKTSPMVVAIGVYGTIPESTRETLLSLGVPSSSVDVVAENLRREVLEQNLKLFLASRLMRKVDIQKKDSSISNATNS
jgi:hypothetical protein